MSEKDNIIQMPTHKLNQHEVNIKNLKAELGFNTDKQTEDFFTAFFAAFLAGFFAAFLVAMVNSSSVGVWTAQSQKHRGGRIPAAWHRRRAQCAEDG